MVSHLTQDTRSAASSVSPLTRNLTLVLGVLGSIGSLWLAAVLLMLLLVGMACATVYESTYGTERALADFYTSWWFATILTLIACNSLAAVILRYPFTKRQIGFVLTHLGILATLGGAWVTQQFGLDARVGFVEGETVEVCHNTHVDALTVLNRRDQKRASLDLTDRVFVGFREAERPQTPRLTLGDLNIQVERFLPDSAWSSRSGASGVVKVDYAGATFTVSLEQGLKQAVPLGDTGITVRVLRYLPHAIVGEDKQLVNASDQPVNPAVEVEVVGPSGSEKRYAFAKFPDFSSMHGKPQVEGLKVTFESGRADWTLEPVEPVRKEREPGLLLTLRTPEHTNTMGVQKHEPRPVTVDGVPYEMSYENQAVPLGFKLTLDRFRVGYYPGGMRPRSFESHVTITDPTTGATQSRIISMNHPLKYGGYSFYQSSYRQGQGQTASFLSVSRDPGQPIVFTGYVTMLVGMLVVLGMRMADRRAAEKSRPG
jgi:hypothetical protein